MNKSRKLLLKAYDPSKLKRIYRQLDKPTGGLNKGKLPDEKTLNRIFGSFSSKIVLAPHNIDIVKNEPLSNFSSVGGWCAIRTNCLKWIEKGYIIDPLTGEKNNIRNINQVATWISKAIALEQITDAVGRYNGDEYIIISEVRLWQERLSSKLSKLLGRKLNSSELLLLEDSIREAELKRFEITKNFINYKKQKDAVVIRIEDTAIYEDLVIARDKLFFKFGLSIQNISKSIVNRAIKRAGDALESNAKEIINSIHDYIDKYSLIWTMYTGYYIDILRSKKILKRKFAIISEPWMHISSLDSEAKAIFNEKIYFSHNAENDFLSNSGINSKLLYIAFTDSADKGKFRVRKSSKISEVPNISNYEYFFDTLLKDESINDLTLSENRAFLAGFSYGSMEDVRENLLKMADISDKYKGEKQNIQKNNKLNDKKKALEISKLRNSFKTKMEIESKTLIQKLSKMSAYLFK